MIGVVKEPCTSGMIVVGGNGIEGADKDLKMVLFPFQMPSCSCSKRYSVRKSFLVQRYRKNFVA